MTPPGAGRGAQSFLRWLLLRRGGCPLDRGPFFVASSSSSELSVSSRSLLSSSTTCRGGGEGAAVTQVLFSARPHFPPIPTAALFFLPHSPPTPPGSLQHFGLPLQPNIQLRAPICSPHLTPRAVPHPPPFTLTCMGPIPPPQNQSYEHPQDGGCETPPKGAVTPRTGAATLPGWGP